MVQKNKTFFFVVSKSQKRGIFICFFLLLIYKTLPKNEDDLVFFLSIIPGVPAGIFVFSV